MNTALHSYLNTAKHYTICYRIMWLFYMRSLQYQIPFLCTLTYTNSSHVLWQTVMYQSCIIPWVTSMYYIDIIQNLLYEWHGRSIKNEGISVGKEWWPQLTTYTSTHTGSHNLPTRCLYFSGTRGPIGQEIALFFTVEDFEGMLLQQKCIVVSVLEFQIYTAVLSLLFKLYIPWENEQYLADFEMQHIYCI